MTPDQPQPEPALDLARELIATLADLAKRLESPTADEGLKEDARRAIRRMYDAWSGLDTNNVIKRDAERRGLLFSVCELAAAHAVEPSTVPPDAVEKRAVQSILKTYGDLVEDHRSKVVENEALVLALFRAHMQSTAVLDAQAELAKAMGFGADHESLKRAERRQRAKQGQT